MTTGDMFVIFVQYGIQFLFLSVMKFTESRAWLTLIFANISIPGSQCFINLNTVPRHFCHEMTFVINDKKVNRNVQSMPQPRTAANPRHREDEKKDKHIHAQNKQTNVREAQRPAPFSPSEVIRMLKQTEKRGHRVREDFKTLSAQ